MGPNGLQFLGGILSRLPDNAPVSDIVNALNTVINKLNTWDGVVVANSSTTVHVSDEAQSLATLPHNLNFTPVIDASLNNVGISFAGSTTLSLPLPCFLTADISGGNVNFGAYMFCMADDKNLYFYTLNATGQDLGDWEVTYYLRRLTANN